MPIRRFVFLLLIGCFLFPQLISAEVDDSIQRQRENWLLLADQVVNYIEKGKYPEARELVTELSNQFSKSDLSAKKLTIEGVHILSDELIFLEHQLSKVVITNPTEILQGAIRLKMTLDAVAHPNQPLWKQYYQPMKQKITAFQLSKTRQDQAAMNQALNGLLQDYKLIRSALVISKKTETMTKIDSVIRFLEKQKRPELQANGMSRFQEMLEPIFFGTDQDVLSAYRPYVDRGIETIIIWLGFWIVMVFAYVSWKKYRLRLT